MTSSALCSGYAATVVSCSKNLTDETEWNLINFTESMESYVELTFLNNNHPEYPRPEQLTVTEKPRNQRISVDKTTRKSLGAN